MIPEVSLLNLTSTRESALLLADKLFYSLAGLPAAIRPDDKERTGIVILAHEPKTRNLFVLQVGSPTETAQFFAIEKAVRAFSRHHLTSQQSEDTERMRYRGSVALSHGDLQYLQVSTSGMKSDEDVAISVIMLAYILQISPAKVCHRLREALAPLPLCFAEPESYLYKSVNYDRVPDPGKDWSWL